MNSPKSDSHPDAAFVSALTNLQSQLRGYCQAALGHGDEAAEALQRTNITLWKKASEWDPEQNFSRWATSIARFEVLGVVRDRQRRNQRYVFDPDVAEQMVDEASERVEPTSARQEALETCLAKVSPKNRDLLSSYFVRGETFQEIASATGRGLSALKVAMMRLRRSLRSCIETQLGKEASV
ncbi:MAG: sigma-70 family RNA polymerase sigma factor [Verrucomicrobiales bacterium]|nr:sigma-70 family RNA polymerase sigma factor [Verrucomicrobiales bacterium]